MASSSCSNLRNMLFHPSEESLSPGARPLGGYSAGRPAAGTPCYRQRPSLDPSSSLRLAWPYLLSIASTISLTVVTSLRLPANLVAKRQTAATDYHRDVDLLCSPDGDRANSRAEPVGWLLPSLQSRCWLRHTAADHSPGRKTPQALLQVLLQGRLVRQQPIQGTVQTVIVDLRGRYAK